MKAMLGKVLVAIAMMNVAFVASARIDQPSHVFYGNATLYGQDVDPGTIIELRLRDDDEVLIRYEMDRDPRLGDQYALPVPMDDVDPRTDGRARPGDEVEIYIGSQLAAETTVGAAGRAVRLDLDPQNLGTGPSISIGDGETFEGDGGTSAVNLEVSMNTTEEQDVAVDWETRDDSAISGVDCSGGVDFLADDGTVVIAEGAQQGTLEVLVCGDTEIEGDEVFYVDLVNASTGVFDDDSGEVTIIEDDDVPEIRVADAWVNEPHDGTAEAVFEVSLSKNSAYTASFDWATQDLSAMAPGDYLSASGTVEIEPGDLTAQFSVTVSADGEVEPQEAFAVNLDNPGNGELARESALGVIVDPKFKPAVDHEQDVIDGEQDVTGIADPSAVAVAPDGGHVYVTSESLDAISIFSRNSLSGRLNLLGSVDSDAGGFDEMALDSPVDLVVSDDGQHLYAAASNDDAVVALARDEGSGNLDFIGNLIEGQTDGDSDQPLTGLQGVSRLHLSADGAHLYASSAEGDSIVVFERDEDSGELTYLETETDGIDDPDDSAPAPQDLERPAGLELSPDGDQLFVTARSGDALVVFDRDNDPESPEFGRLGYRQSLVDGLDGINGLDGATDVAVSADGGQVYVSAEEDDGLVRLARDSDGELELVEILTQGDDELPGMAGAQHVQLAPDNTELFITGFDDNSLTLFERLTDDGDVGEAGELLVRQTLFDGQGTVLNMGGPTDMATSADDRHLYVVASTDNAIIVFGRISVDILFKDGFEPPGPR